MRKRELASNMAKEIETPRTNPNSPRTGELVSSMSSSKLSTIDDEENQAQALSKLIPGASANVKGEELKVLEKQLSGLTPGWYIFPTLKDYSITRQLASDIVAGITVGSLAVPQSMSYAMIAGLPVQNGLYSDLQIAYPLLGSSRHLVVGPVAIMSLLTMEALKGTGVAPLSAQWIVLCSLLSCFVGLYQLVFAGMQAGELISTAVSENSVKAFTACAALTIASTQIPSLLGVACDDGGTTSCGSYYLLKRGLVDDPNGISLIVSGLSVVILEGVRTTFKDRLVAKMGSLIVMFIGIKIAVMIPYGFVQTVGYIPQGLPSTSPVTSYFSVEPVHVIRLALSAGPISLLGFAEAYAIAKAKSKDALNPNRELAALGLANVWTAFLGGYACTGSFSRSAVNAEAGSTSGISCFVAAAFVVLVLQMLTTELSMLPKACVAAVVVSAIVRLIDYKYPKRLYMNGEKRHLLAYCIIFITGLTFGVEVGLLLGFTMDTINRLSGRTLAPVAEMLEWRETSPKHRWIF